MNEVSKFLRDMIGTVQLSNIVSVTGGVVEGAGDTLRLPFQVHEIMWYSH